jgi:hypothetical protein
MSQIKNPELILITAGGRIKCRRCTAKSSYTKEQCKRPASKLSKASKCSRHGGLSTGPKTKAGKDRIRATHFKHGEETLEAKAERSARSLMFRYLTDIGNHCQMFYKEIKARGRPPSEYTQLNLKDPEQLTHAILKILPSYTDPPSRS